MKKAIITGPTGVIGLALADELLKNGYQVAAIVRPGSRRVERLPKNENLEVIEGNLNALDSLYNDIKHLGKFDLFYHLGWDYSREHNNIEMQLKNISYVLEAVSLASKMGCSCFVGCGSQAEYGRCDGIIDEKTFANPEMAYGIAKLCAGQIGRLQCESNNIRFVWPRIFSIYGPGDEETTMVMSVIRQLLKREEPALTEGQQMWDFLYASDAAAALRLLGECDICEGVYCIAGGHARPLKTYIEQIRDCIDSGLSLGFGRIPYSNKQVMNLSVSINKLQKDTGFFPKVDFADGIMKTVEWCRDNPDIKYAGHGE